VDDGIIEDWFHAYSDDVYNYLVYRTRSKDVDDMVQDTFLRALRSIHTFHEMASPKTWLIAIARRVALDDQRKIEQRHELSLSISEIPSNERSPLDTVVQNEAVITVMQCLDQLKSNYRDVVVLRTVIGLSTRETAKVMGWSESHVKVTLHRALRQVRLLLQKPAQGGNAHAPKVLR
jgi:RNA polymerase sigma-70 factor, ECF subfamily